MASLPKPDISAAKKDFPTQNQTENLTKSPEGMAVIFLSYCVLKLNIMPFWHMGDGTRKRG